MMSLSSRGSKESIYTSAPNSDLEDFGDVSEVSHLRRRRPPYLSGSSESSLIDDTTRRKHFSLSTLHSLTEKFPLQIFNRVLFKPKHARDEVDLVPPENEIRVRLLGFETIERHRRFTVTLKNTR